MLIEEMLDQLETVGRRKTDRMIWESILYYYGSIALNKYRFVKSVGSTKNIKYYSIVFAKSSAGKSFAMKKVEKLFNFGDYGGLMSYFYKKQIERLPTEPDIVDEILRYMPKSVTIGVEGTTEGLFQVIQSQAASGFGSLNLSTDEFGETIASSSGLLSKLKEIYDGKFQAKIIKGDTSYGEMKEDINGIVCNFIGLGSRKGVTSDAAKELKRIATSGMYRRTFIIESNSIVEKNIEPDNIEKLQDYLNELNRHLKEDFKLKMEQDLFFENYFKYSKDFLEKIEEIDDLLIKNANENQLDEFAQYNSGSLEMIIDLAHIIAFLEWDHEISSKHINKAYDFLVRTRKSVEDTFKTIHPYKLMYDLLKLKANMTISEMAEFEHNVPIIKTKVNDNIALLEELCYRNDEVLIKNEGKVTRFSIEPLPITKLDKLIVSIGMDNRGPRSTHFVPHTISWEILRKLVKSQKRDSFTTAHFKDEYRKKDNFIEGQNLIAFDIDAGMKIKDAQEIFSNYTYLIYTTKSHLKEKGEQGIEERFRLIIPTKTIYYVTEDQHKRMYDNIAKAFDITNDTQTKNVSRLWFTNPEAKLYENMGELLDITPYIPDTIKSEKIMPKIENINQEVEEGELSRREAGFIKYFIANTYKGNRNTSLYNAAKFFQDIGTTNIYSKLRRLNYLIDEPLPDHEFEILCKSAKII